MQKNTKYNVVLILAERCGVRRWLSQALALQTFFATFLSNVCDAVRCKSATTASGHWSLLESSHAPRMPFYCGKIDGVKATGFASTLMCELCH